jgi:hypothetical protein
VITGKTSQRVVGGVILPVDLEYELLLKTYHQGSKPVKAA